MRKCKPDVLGVVFARVHEPSQQPSRPLANAVFRFLSRGRKVHSLLITVRKERRISNYRCNTHSAMYPRATTSPRKLAYCRKNHLERERYERDYLSTGTKVLDIFLDVTTIFSSALKVETVPSMEHHLVDYRLSKLNFNNDVLTLHFRCYNFESASNLTSVSWNTFVPVLRCLYCGGMLGVQGG